MTIHWGIIGCGDVCEVKSGPAFYKIDGSALTAVMRRDAAKAEDFAKRHGVPRWTIDADAIIRGDDVDIVYIATPPGSHLEYALRVAQAGKPCYVEKPMARSAAECRAMVAAFEKARQPLFVAYYRRMLPRFVKVKELLDAGAIGTVTGVCCRINLPRGAGGVASWRVDAATSGGGLFLDLASHALDLLDHLLGPLTRVAGIAVNRAGDYDAEDTAAMSFEIAGAPGTAACNFAASRRDDALTLDGTDGRIACSVFGNEPVRLIRADGEESFDLPNPPHVHQPLVRTIVDELRGAGVCPSTGATALRTSAVMDAVLADYYGGRDDAFWDRPHTWPGRRAGR